MEAAGFKNVEIRLVTKAFPVTTIPEFRGSMVNGSAHIQMMKKGLGDLWPEKEKLALAYLKEALPKIPTELTSDAWLGLGIK